MQKKVRTNTSFSYLPPISSSKMKMEKGGDKNKPTSNQRLHFWHQQRKNQQWKTIHTKHNVFKQWVVLHTPSLTHLFYSHFLYPYPSLPLLVSILCINKTSTSTDIFPGRMSLCKLLYSCSLQFSQPNTNLTFAIPLSTMHHFVIPFVL